MSAPEFPMVPVGDDGPTLVGNAGVRCDRCGDMVPVPIEVEIGPDEDGDPALFTRGSTFELEAHLLRHVAEDDE